MFHPSAGPSADEFLRVNERVLFANAPYLSALRQRHPDRTDADLVHALGQAKALLESSCRLRLTEVASWLLGSE